jgi:hypothetical protein
MLNWPLEAYVSLWKSYVLSSIRLQYVHRSRLKVAGALIIFLQALFSLSSSFGIRSQPATHAREGQHQVPGTAVRVMQASYKTS